MSNQDTKRLLRDVKEMMKRIEEREKERSRMMVHLAKQCVELAEEDDCRVPVFQAFIRKYDNH